MPIAIVSGSGGLIGSEAVRFFASQDLDIVGLDNDMRAYFFGAEASTKPTSQRLVDELEGSFRAVDLDIRDQTGVDRLFAELGAQIELVVHVSDFRPFRADYPDWELTYGVESVLKEIFEHNVERWTNVATM